MTIAGPLGEGSLLEARNAAISGSIHSKVQRASFLAGGTLVAASAKVLNLAMIMNETVDVSGSLQRLKVVTATESTVNVGGDIDTADFGSMIRSRLYAGVRPLPAESPALFHSMTSSTHRPSAGSSWPKRCFRRRDRCRAFIRGLTLKSVDPSFLDADLVMVADRFGPIVAHQSSFGRRAGTVRVSRLENGVPISDRSSCGRCDTCGARGFGGQPDVNPGALMDDHCEVEGRPESAAALRSFLPALCRGVNAGAPQWRRFLDRDIAGRLPLSVDSLWDGPAHRYPDPHDACPMHVAHFPRTGPVRPAFWVCRGGWIFLAFSDVAVVSFWPQIAVSYREGRRSRHFRRGREGAPPAWLRHEARLR